MDKQSKKQDKQYQIPMVVSDEVIRDFGIKQEDVTWRRHRKPQVPGSDGGRNRGRVQGVYGADLGRNQARGPGWPLHGQGQKRQADPLPRE